MSSLVITCLGLLAAFAADACAALSTADFSPGGLCSCCCCCSCAATLTENAGNRAHTPAAHRRITPKYLRRRTSHFLSLIYSTTYTFFFLTSISLSSNCNRHCALDCSTSHTCSAPGCSLNERCCSVSRARIFSCSDPTCTASQIEAGCASRCSPSLS